MWPVLAGGQGGPECELFLPFHRRMCPPCLRITQPAWRQRNREWSLVSGTPQVRLLAPNVPFLLPLGCCSCCFLEIVFLFDGEKYSACQETERRGPEDSLVGCRGRAWSTQLSGPGVQNGRTPEVTHSFRGLDGEVNEPLTTWGQSDRASHFHSLPPRTHTAVTTPEQSQLRLEAGLLEAVVAEAGRLSCFCRNIAPDSVFSRSVGCHCCLPQLSSARHTAAAQG